MSIESQIAGHYRKMYQIRTVEEKETLKCCNCRKRFPADTMYKRSYGKLGNVNNICAACYNRIRNK